MAEIAEQVQETTEVQPTANDKLQAAVWGDAPIQQPSTEVKTEEVKKEEEIKKEEPVVTEWYKSFGYENEDSAKTEIQKLKEAKPQEELKFANDDSKKFFDYLKEGKEDDVYSYLEKKKTVEKLLSSEVDEKNAADIVKFALKNKNSEYSKEDIERKFNRQFGIPKEPVYNELKESEDEFKERHDEWGAKAKDIKADLLLEAKDAKVELAKLKTELVLPDIQKNNPETQRQPTQEEIAAFTKQKESFLQATNLFLNEFNGFSTQVKDKDVDYGVSYGTSQEEKQMALKIAQEFAEAGFDANALFVKDWLNKDGTLNVKQIIEDKVLLANKDKVLSKIANDAANQRLEIYLKDKKRITVGAGGGHDFGVTEGEKTQSEKLQETFWAS